MKKQKKLVEEWEDLFGTSVDNNLFLNDLSLNGSRNLFKQFVKIVNIETFSYCNRKCSYCPVSQLQEKEKNYLDENTFISIINDLQSIDYSNKISLNLYNEPLSDDSIFNTLKYIRDNLPKTTLFFNSNGDYVTKENLKKLSENGLNSLNITLHTLPNKHYNDNDSLEAIKKFYSKIDRDYTIDSQKKDEYIHTSFQFEKLLVNVVTSNYDDYGESRAGSIPELVKDQKRDWPCTRPFREFTIFSNGHVYPCCQIYAPLDNLKNSMGDLRNDNIFNIYSSKKLAYLRKHLFDYSIKRPPCDKCTEPFLHKQKKKLV
jgi:radical SAM protein with 4Fe4S-binding SPASM domain